MIIVTILAYKTILFTILVVRNDYTIILLVCCDNNIHIHNLLEPRHEISNNVVCAISKGSDQPAHMRSLIRAIASRLNIL